MSLVKMFQEHPIAMGFHATCMSSMILMCFDPSFMTWISNFGQHMVAGFSNLGPALSSLSGVFNPASAGTAVATASVAAPVSMPLMPGMDHSMMGHSIGGATAAATPAASSPILCRPKAPGL